MIWLLAYPLSSPVSQSISSTVDTEEDSEKKNLLTGGGGMGEETNHATARKPTQLSSINHSILAD
jgi:hypothetical protein